MSSQQSLIPLESFPLSPHWSFEPGDISRIESLLDIPAQPKPILSLPWRKKSTTRQPYKAGDPIFLGGPSIPFTFEGFTGKRCRNAAGENVEMALFQNRTIAGPTYSFNLPLYPGRVIESNQAPTHSSFWGILKEYLGGCFH